MSSYDDEKADDNGCLTRILLVVVVMAACKVLQENVRQKQPETQTADATTRERRWTPPVPGNSEAREGDHSPSLALQPSEPHAAQGDLGRYSSPPSLEVEDHDETKALRASLGEFELSDPSAGTIAWMTIELWRQPEFLELTQEEAHALLAEDDHLGLSGQESLLSLIGPLPTLEDCEAGMRSEAVQAALEEVLVYEAPLIKLGEIPDHRRGHWAEQRRLELVRMKTEAEIDLMRALEEATGYPNWRLLMRLYERWSGH